MSIDGLMRTSVSGMEAQSNKLGAVAGNIANASTVGFKRLDTQFSTMLVETPRTFAPSMGVESYVRHAISSQGQLQATSSRFDLAVNGSGMLVVAGQEGDPVLTRAGSFVPDGNGRLVNAAGFTLLGAPPGATGAGIGLGDLVPVVLGGDRLEATPTTQAKISANLPSFADVVAASDLPSANAVGSVSTASASLVAYGSLGEQVLLDVHFTRTANPGEWDVSVFDAAGRPARGAFPYSSAPLASATMTFAGNGQIDFAGTTSLAVPVPGGVSLNLDLADMTQLSSDFVVLGDEANGNPASAVASVEIDGQGVVTQIYGNGARRDVFRIPIAAVNSPDNMAALDGNTYRATSQSGDIRLGIPGTAGFGAVVSGALESSNVDMASELTDMIAAQRSYTANSRVFQTGSEIMDVIVNLKR